MLPILTSSQIREADAYTITHEPIASVYLMERAAAAFVSCFIDQYPDKAKSIAVYCGTGNNGGDGLAIARMLYRFSYQNISVKIARFSDRSTDDFIENFKRIRHKGIELLDIKTGEALPAENSDIVRHGVKQAIAWRL